MISPAFVLVTSVFASCSVLPLLPLLVVSHWTLCVLTHNNGTQHLPLKYVLSLCTFQTWDIHLIDPSSNSSSQRCLQTSCTTAWLCTYPIMITGGGGVSNHESHGCAGSKVFSKLQCKLFTFDCQIIWMYKVIKINFFMIQVYTHGQNGGVSFSSTLHFVNFFPAVPLLSLNRRSTILSFPLLERYDSSVSTRCNSTRHTVSNSNMWS